MENKYPDYVPVIKGNGYGFGNRYLADTIYREGKEEIAVGTLEEARQLGKEYTFRQMIVLTPVMTELDVSDLVSGRIYTVGSREQLQYLVTSFDRILSDDRRSWAKTGAPFKLNILLKCQSSMKRYGFSLEDATNIQQWIHDAETDRVHIEIKGLSIHFPKEGLSFSQKKQAIGEWIETLRKSGFSCCRMYVSHLSSQQYRDICKKWPSVHFSIRLGTDLWLYDKSFIETKSTVLDIKKIKRGERFGYKQFRSLKSGYLVYVSGGTANGVGLEAPVFPRSWKERLKLTVFWGLSLFKLQLSPFTYKGKRFWYAEPPHMQTTVLFFPSKATLPEVGEELLVQLRMTTATFDRKVEMGKEMIPYERESEQQEEKGKVQHVIS